MEQHISEIIVALITLIGTVGLGLLQRNLLKKQADKLDEERNEMLFKRAMELNKCELDTLRAVNSELRELVEDKDKIITKRDIRIEELENKNERLEKIIDKDSGG